MNPLTTGWNDYMAGLATQNHDREGLWLDLYIVGWRFARWMCRGEHDAKD